MTTIFESKHYRIEYHPTINRRSPYALDYKEHKDGRVCLVNIGWFEAEHLAHQAKNKHWEENHER